MSTGKILQVIGPVIDVRFEAGHLPAIYNAIKVTNPSISDKEGNLIVEAAQHLGDNVVRCVAMDSTEGLVRGMDAIDTGGPITVPVGPATLGRVMNVIGEPADELGVAVAEEGLRLVLEVGIVDARVAEERVLADLDVVLLFGKIVERVLDPEGRSVLLELDVAHVLLPGARM